MRVGMAKARVAPSASRSDVADASLKVYTFPEIQGTPGWDEAQHRQPKGLQWLMREPQYSEYKVGEAKWFVFIDDDTWINYQALHGALARINSNTRLAMGYIWHQVYSDFDHYSGGSGEPSLQRGSRGLKPAQLAALDTDLAVLCGRNRGVGPSGPRDGQAALQGRGASRGS